MSGLHRFRTRRAGGVVPVYCGHCRTVRCGCWCQSATSRAPGSGREPPDQLPTRL